MNVPSNTPRFDAAVREVLDGKRPWATMPGDCRETMRELPDASAQVCVTSPPYYNLRDYGSEPTRWPEVVYAPMSGLAPVVVPEMDGWLGREDSPAAYVGHLVLVMREVARVLRDDGTLWLNLGDSYAADRTYQVPPTKWKNLPQGQPSTVPIGLKPKDLMGIPWRVAFALQADGWFLRTDVVWAKPNPLPESVLDRPTRAHEFVFLFSKSERYFYDSAAISEKATGRSPGNRTHKYTDAGVSRQLSGIASVAVRARRSSDRGCATRFPPPSLRPARPTGCEVPQGAAR